MSLMEGRDPAEIRAWALMALDGEDRQFAGNDGYPDLPDVSYHWDSTVPRARDLAKGDVIAIWDKSGLIGTSVIEAIHEEPGSKTLYRCAQCGSAKIKRRRSDGSYKCGEPGCGRSFDQPARSVVEIDRFVSVHDAAWTDQRGTLDATEVRSLCVSPKSQHSMRPLRWTDFRTALEAKGSAALETIEQRASMRTSGASGHRHALTRVRIGQSGFRQRLIARFGPTCAITGSAPTEVLEAGHLYSYAALGLHHDHGGLLFRRDIHALFDRGQIGIDPRSVSARVAPALLSYDAYGPLDRRPLKVQLSPEHRVWAGEHWNQHAKRHGWS